MCEHEKMAYWVTETVADDDDLTKDVASLRAILNESVPFPGKLDPAGKKSCRYRINIYFLFPRHEVLAPLICSGDRERKECVQCCYRAPDMSRQKYSRTGNKSKFRMYMYIHMSPQNIEQTHVQRATCGMSVRLGSQCVRRKHFYLRSRARRGL